MKVQIRSLVVFAVGNILPHFEWGEFLIWYFSPLCRVAMDGRYETVYQDQVSREYFLFA